MKTGHGGVEKLPHTIQSVLMSTMTTLIRIIMAFSIQYSEHNRLPGVLKDVVINVFKSEICMSDGAIKQIKPIISHIMATGSIPELDENHPLTPLIIGDMNKIMKALGRLSMDPNFNPSSTLEKVSTILNVAEDIQEGINELEEYDTEEELEYDFDEDELEDKDYFNEYRHCICKDCQRVQNAKKEFEKWEPSDDFDKSIINAIYKAIEGKKLDIN